MSNIANALLENSGFNAKTIHMMYNLNSDNHADILGDFNRARAAANKFATQSAGRANNIATQSSGTLVPNIDDDMPSERTALTAVGNREAIKFGKGDIRRDNATVQQMETILQDDERVKEKDGDNNVNFAKTNNQTYLDDLQLYL
jgi:hypothetical protein